MVLGSRRHGRTGGVHVASPDRRGVHARIERQHRLVVEGRRRRFRCNTGGAKSQEDDQAQDLILAKSDHFVAYSCVWIVQRSSSSSSRPSHYTIVLGESHLRRIVALYASY